MVKYGLTGRVRWEKITGYFDRIMKEKTAKEEERRARFDTRAGGIRRRAEAVEVVHSHERAAEAADEPTDSHGGQSGGMATPAS